MPEALHLISLVIRRKLILSFIGLRAVHSPVSEACGTLKVGMLSALNQDFDFESNKETYRVIEKAFIIITISLAPPAPSKHVSSIFQLIIIIIISR